MRTTSRTLLSTLLTAPLLVGLVAPASAAESGQIRSSGSFAGIQLSGPETSDAIPGNYLDGGVDVYGDSAYGYAMTFDCADGATPYDGEGCDYLGDVMLEGSGLTSSTGKGRHAATHLSGELFASMFSWDEETGEEAYLDLGVLTLDATVTPYGKAARMTSTETYRDAETGESFTVRSTQTVYRATASGTLGDLVLDDQAYVGTYRSAQRWITP